MISPQQSSCWIFFFPLGLKLNQVLLCLHWSDAYLDYALLCVVFCEVEGHLKEKWKYLLKYLLQKFHLVKFGAVAFTWPRRNKKAEQLNGKLKYYKNLFQAQHIYWLNKENDQRFDQKSLVSRKSSKSGSNHLSVFYPSCWVMWTDVAWSWFVSV